MAKIKRRRLKWEPSKSSQVIGYKLYWEEGSGVDYDSDFAIVGNVTEVILPDDVKSFPVVQQAVELGVTALNEVGNESDMIKIYASFQFSVPDIPKKLEIEKADGYHVYVEPIDHIDHLKGKINPFVSDNEDDGSYDLANRLNIKFK